MQETWETRVPSLGREDPLGEGMATPSSILAWRIPWTEEPGRPQSIAEQRVRHNWSDLACTRILDDVEDGPWAFHLFCKDSVSAYWVLPMLFKEIPLLPPPNPPQKKKNLGWFLAVLQGAKWPEQQPPPLPHVFSALYVHLSCKWILKQNQIVDSNMTFEFCGGTWVHIPGTYKLCDFGPLT